MCKGIYLAEELWEISTREFYAQSGVTKVNWIRIGLLGSVEFNPKCHYHFYVCICTLATSVGIHKHVLEWYRMNEHAQSKDICNRLTKGVLDLHRHATTF